MDIQLSPHVTVISGAKGGKYPDGNSTMIRGSEGVVLMLTGAVMFVVVVFGLCMASPFLLGWQALRAAYLARFPEAEPMTQLGDFRFVALRPVAGRHVAGFGAARSVDNDEWARVLTVSPAAADCP